MAWGNLQEKYTKACMRILVYRYCYYVLSRPLVADAQYDVAEQKLRRVEQQYPDLVHPESPTQHPGSDNPEAYPAGVRWHCEANVMGRTVGLDGRPVPVERLPGLPAGFHEKTIKCRSCGLGLYAKGVSEEDAKAFLKQRFAEGGWTVDKEGPRCPGCQPPGR